MEVAVDIRNIPSIPDESLFERFKKCCINPIIHFITHNISCVVLIIVILIVVGAVIGVLLTSKQVNLPCSKYSSDTFATEVTVDCLQYVWNTECPTKPFTFPVGYTGWWRQSPQGSTLVRCSNGVSGTQCGVGTYGSILVYMQFCNVYYSQ
jgi:hypothetical protein